MKALSPIKKIAIVCIIIYILLGPLVLIPLDIIKWSQYVKLVVVLLLYIVALIECDKKIIVKLKLHIKMKKKTIISIILGVILLAGIGYLVYTHDFNGDPIAKQLQIRDAEKPSYKVDSVYHSISDASFAYIVQKLSTAHVKLSKQAIVDDYRKNDSIYKYIDLGVKYDAKVDSILIKHGVE
jgi:hypothetical protein